MNRKTPFQSASLALLLVIALIPTSHIFAQGNYTPITEDEVVSLKLNHYFTANKKGHQADFAWSFTKTDFVIKEGKGSIPTDLLELLLPKGTTAEEIRGKWKLNSKDGKLIFSEIQAGDKPGKEEASLVIYKTAPTVIRIGEPQYVFGIGK